MEQGIWQEIEQLYQKFQQLGISEAVDYDKYYLYFLITHSTAIEGSTLTELDIQLLFDEGVTAKGKPLVYHLMNEDLKNTYELCTIYPWVDGNGRASRLLMNYVQFLYNLFPTKIFKEDRDEYILSLRQSQDEDSNLSFLIFMANQLKKSLSLEIERFNASQKKGFSFMF